MSGIAALGAGKVALGFLGGNWRWLVPAAAFLALGAYAGDRTVRLSNLRAEVASDKADRAAAVLAQKERDRLLAIAVEAERAERDARASAVVVPQMEAISRAKVLIPTVDTPAMRAADDGLLGLGFRRAPRSGAGAAGGPAAAP